MRTSAEDFGKLSDEEYQQLRSEILSNYGSMPTAAAEKANEFLRLYQDRFTLPQNLRMHYTKAYFLIGSEQFEAAYQTLSKCKLLADELNEPNLTYYYYTYLGGMLSTLTSYQLSLETYLKALDYAEKSDNPNLIAEAYNNVGHVLIKSQQFEKAKPYIDKFYQYGLETDGQSYIATALNNLGEISLGQKNYQQAKSHFLASLVIRDAKGYLLNSSWPHYNLGKVFLALKQFPKSIYHLQKAIDIRIEFDMELESLKPQVALAEVYLQQRQFDQALPLINRIINKANQDKHYQLASDGYQLLKDFHESQQQWQLALKASNDFTDNKQALMEQRASIALMHYVAIADLNNKEIDNLALRKENELINQKAEAKHTQLMMMLSLGAFIIFIILFFMKQLSLRNKRLNATIDVLQKTQQELIEADKMSAMTTLVSGIAHQLNTPLSVVITANSIMREKLQIIEKQFQSKALTLNSFEQYIEEAKSVLSLSEKNSEKTAELVQRFKLISAELEGSQVSHFELKLFLLEKLRLIATQYQKSLTVEVTGQEVRVLNYPDVLFKVLEQLVKNSVDHKPENMGTLSALIDIDKEDNRVNIVYTDNGQGISEKIRDRIFDPFFTTKGMQKSLGLGLNIAYNSVLHLMQGKLSCQSSISGARFVIEIPISIEQSSDAPP